MRILFISPLDRRTVANTREENISAACRALGHATLTLTLTQNTGRGLRAVLRDTLSWRVAPLADGLRAIDPPFNPCTGLKTNADAQAGQAAAAEHGTPRRFTQAGRCLVAGASPLGLLRDLPIVPAFVIEALRHGRFDLCIAYGPWAACTAWWLRRLCRVDRVLYDDQDFEPAILANALRRHWAARLERTMMQRADRVVSVGERLAALRRVQTGREVVVVPNGVRSRIPALLARAPSGVASNRPFTLVYVGNVVAWSGLDVMLQGLPALLSEGKALHVLIVGDGLPAYVQGLQAQVAVLGLADVVRFTGRMPNERIGEFLAQADVGLAHFRPEPYRRYAFPLKVVEYMAAGLPVIGTQGTETADIIARHCCGISVPFDARAIAGAVRRLIDDPAAWTRYRQCAYDAAAGYDWAALAARLLTLAAPRAMQGSAQAPGVSISGQTDACPARRAGMP